jgi:hypothetical protein
MRFTIRQQPAEPVDSMPPLSQFPFSIGASEPLEQYRHSCRHRMRSWVVFTIGELADFNTIPEDEARILCEYTAKGQLARGLHSNESTLMSEGVRDVIIARETLQRNAEWLSDFQASHTGDMAS